MFYEVKVRGTHEAENGTIKVKDTNVIVNIPSTHPTPFAVAESLALEYANNYITEPIVKAIKASNVSEVAENDELKEKYYKVKVIMLVLDEVGKETKSKVVYLIPANNPVEADKAARKAIGEETDYEVSDITETKIEEVLKHED